MSPTPRIPHQDEQMPTDPLSAVLQELRRLGGAVDSLTEKLDDKLNQMRVDTEQRAKDLEKRVRDLELDAARVGVRLGLVGTISAIVGGAIAEGLALLLTGHHP